MDHEREARRRKAIRLADWCRSMGFTADIVINDMTPVIREQACKDAGVNVASAQTWELVVGLLGAHAAIERSEEAKEAMSIERGSGRPGL